MAEELLSGYGPSTFDPGYDARDISQDYQAGQRDSGYQSGDFDAGYVARELGQDYTARDLESQYAGNVDTGPAFEAGSITDEGVMEGYMTVSYTHLTLPTIYSV